MDLENISTEMDEIVPEPSVYTATVNTVQYDTNPNTENTVYVVDAPSVVDPISTTPAIQTTEKVPKMVFIVPYRDRLSQYQFFIKHMKDILEDIPKEDYSIYFIHQCDTRGFNRGAMKNIGFLMVKEKYPDKYKDITLIFNDVDTMPLVKNVIRDYNTQRGIVKHFYGFTYALGGIFSINAGDFERINGFPNLWSWGYEDNEIQVRCKNNRLFIDRSNFSPIFNKDYILLHDDIRRTANRKDFNNFVSKIENGLNTISHLKYTIDESSHLVNVTGFLTMNIYDPAANKTIDLRETSAPFKRNVIGMNFM